MEDHLAVVIVIFMIAVFGEYIYIYICIHLTECCCKSIIE